MTELNLDLLKKVLDKIVAEPDDHNQLHWMVFTGPIEPAKEFPGGVALAIPVTSAIRLAGCAGYPGRVPRWYAAVRSR